MVLLVLYTTTSLAHLSHPPQLRPAWYCTYKMTIRAGLLTTAAGYSAPLIHPSIPHPSFSLYILFDQHEVKDQQRKNCVRVTYPQIATRYAKTCL